MSTWIHTKERRPTTADLPVWFSCDGDIDIKFETVPFPESDYYWMPAKPPEPPKAKRELKTINDYAVAYGEAKAFLMHLDGTKPGLREAEAAYILSRARALGHLDQ